MRTQSWLFVPACEISKKFVGGLQQLILLRTQCIEGQLVEYLLSLSHAFAVLRAFFVPPGGRWSEREIDGFCLVRRLKERNVGSCASGKPPRQAPRFPTVLLAAFEDNVVSLDAPVFWRVMSWWLLLQSWATLRFDDHRGIIPAEVKVSNSGLHRKLTRSKVSGPDKKLNFRLLVVHPSSCVHQKDWLVAGWNLLEKEAPYWRDYLLRAPANNYRGLRRKELSYQTAFAVQSQIISLASYRGLKIFRMSTGHFYTPHSGRNFMPSATAVLNFSRSNRDMLGGWAAEGSQRYSRAAKHMIASMGNAVSMTFKSTQHDPLAEADDLDAMSMFLKSWDVTDEKKKS